MHPVLLLAGVGSKIFVQYGADEEAGWHERLVVGVYASDEDRVLVMGPDEVLDW